MGKKEGMKEATVDGIFIEVFSAFTKEVYLSDCSFIHLVYTRSNVPGQFSLSRDVPGQNHFPNRTQKQEKDILKQEKDALKQERMF